MKTLCSKLYLTRAIKTQNKAQEKETSVTLDGATLTDWLIRWSSNEWQSVWRGIPLCLPITHSEKLPRRLISLQNEHLLEQMEVCLGKTEATLRPPTVKWLQPNQRSSRHFQRRLVRASPSGKSIEMQTSDTLSSVTSVTAVTATLSSREHRNC
jgi:hypothetical protein